MVEKGDLPLENSYSDINTEHYYLVLPLPPSMKDLVWDFGTLDQDQVKQYIGTKTNKLLDKYSKQELDNLLLKNLSNLVYFSHDFVKKNHFAAAKSKRIYCFQTI
jgi:hypothetical protein